MFAKSELKLSRKVSCKSATQPGGIGSTTINTPVSLD